MASTRIRGHKVPSSAHSYTRFLIVMAILITLLILDVSLIRIYDFASKFFIPIQAREILFTIVSTACLSAVFLLLELIRPLRAEQERKTRLYILIVYRITKIVQYVVGVIVAYTIMQVLLSSSFSTLNLLLVIACSYMLTIGILSLFMVRMLSILSINRNMVVLVLFVVAIGSVTANIIITLVDVSLRLLERPSETRVFLGASTDLGKGRFKTVDDLYLTSYLLSFITAWVATVTLLRYYSRKFGKMKYWLVTAGPMIFFMSQYVALYANILFPFIDLDPFFISTMVTVVGTISKPVAGLMLAIGFWTIARVVEKKSSVRGYLIFAGFGFFLLFSSNQAILMSVAPYPPFGLATVTAIGISAYLVVVGLYTSTVSLSQDTELRRSIRLLASSQSTLFDSMVSGESAKEIEERVMEIVKKHSLELEDHSGIETSLDDVEVQRYLKEVIEEVKRRKA
jgi:hypothetical protein